MYKLIAITSSQYSIICTSVPEYKIMSGGDSFVALLDIVDTAVPQWIYTEFHHKVTNLQSL